MNRQSGDEKICFGNTIENNRQNNPFHNCLGKKLFLPSHPSSLEPRTAVGGLSQMYSDAACNLKREVEAGTRLKALQEGLEF